MLVQHGVAPRRTHDLVALLAECVALDASLSDLEPDCRQLAALALGVRYPEDIFEPSEEDARSMMRMALSVRDRILAKLPPLGG